MQPSPQTAQLSGSCWTYCRLRLPLGMPLVSRASGCTGLVLNAAAVPQFGGPSTSTPVEALEGLHTARCRPGKAPVLACVCTGPCGADVTLCTWLQADPAQLQQLLGPLIESTTNWVFEDFAAQGALSASPGILQPDWPIHHCPSCFFSLQITQASHGCGGCLAKRLW